MVDVTRLFALQKLDMNQEKVRRRLLQIQQALGESEELKAVRLAAATAEGELHHWKSEQRQAELEAASLIERIRAGEKRLMSGEVRHPKELEQLQASVEALRRQRSAVEDTGMEAFLQAEACTKLLAERQASLAQVEQSWRAGQGDLVQEEAKLKRFALQLKQQRTEAASVVDAASLKLYETLRQRKAGVAVAPLQNGQCGACHVQVPTGVASAVLTGRGEIVYCTSCGRILCAP